jgi:diacylglycerol O-acyltransferase
MVAAALDRLSRQDVSNLRVEARGMPMHVAALAILDGAHLLDHDGSLRIEHIQAELERRLVAAPRLRQLIQPVGHGLGGPLWVDEPGFDIARHVGQRHVPPPGDDTTLLALCAELNESPLSRTRPLWELWLLPGLADGRLGILIRLHHVVADGIASVALMGALFDSDEATATAPPPFVPAPAPTSAALLTDRIRRDAAALARWVAALAHPGDAIARVRAATTLAREAVEERAPTSSLNVPVGRGRRIRLASADLEQIRAAAHERSGTINDVVLAAVAGGARELLGSRGELTGESWLRASVPVSVRASTDRGLGNRTSLMIVPLPVGEPDPIRRLDAIVRAPSERKRRPRSVTSAVPGPAVVQRALLRLMDRQRLVNLFVSNVPGPPTTLSFMGAPVHDVFQIGALQGNVTLGVGALSYAGRLELDVVGDADACPDIDAFVDGLVATLEQLDVATTRASPARSGP